MTWLASALALLAAVPPSPLGSSVALPTGPASVRGLADSPEMSVFTGQIAYSIPIDVPTGPGGFGPALSLSYNGALGNGPVGIGWSLLVPQIRRSTRLGVPSYEDARPPGPGTFLPPWGRTIEDELELVGLGGGRLVPFAPGEYRVEGQGHALRIEKTPSTFRLTTAQGLQYTFGGGPLLAVYSDARIFAWALKEVLDPSTGRKVTFTYTADQAQLCLSEVTWGPDVNGEPAHRVEYTTASRPDAVVSYREGFRVVTAKRLTRIDVRTSGALVRRYELTYDDAFPVSRLAQVVVLGTDGVTRLPPVTFTYGDEALGASGPGAHEVPETGGWVLGERGVGLLDVDGDGLSDLARFELGARWFRRNLGGTFEAPRPLDGGMKLDWTQVSHLDLTGDARPDMVYVGDDTWRVYQLVGGALPPAVSESVAAQGGGIVMVGGGSLPTPPSGLPSDRDTELHYELVGTWEGTDWDVSLRDSATVHGDLNGDGRMDVVRQTYDGLSIRFGGQGKLLAPVRVGPISAAEPALEFGREDVQLHDVNGDGLADAVWLADEFLQVNLGLGDGRFVPEGDPWAYPWSTPWVDLANVRLGDLNRDGLLDLMRIEAGNVHFWAGHVGGFAPIARILARPDEAAYDDEVTIADLDGNGSQDLVWSARSGRMWYLDLAGPATQGMLTRIANGLGKTVDIAYTTSSLEQLRAEEQQQTWLRKLPVAVAVPNQVTVRTGVPTDPPRVVEYQTLDGFWDADERRFGGFLTTATIHPDPDPVKTLRLEVLYDEGTGLNRALRGKAWHEVASRGDGPMFHETIHVLDTLLPSGFPTDDALLRIPIVTRTFRNERECACPSPTHVQTRYEHDADGNVVVERRDGRSDLEGDETVIRREFAKNDETNVRGVVCSERVESADGVVASHVRTFYDLDALEDAGACPAPVVPHAEDACAVTWGRPSEVTAWLATESRWVPQKRTRYDSVGNVTCATDAGITRRLDYDALRQVPTQETLNPGGTPAFTWTFTSHPVLGLVTAVAGPNAPNGDLAAFEYDPLGRVARVLGDWNGDGAVEELRRFEYPWETHAPLPRTVVVASDWGLDPVERTTVLVHNGAGQPVHEARDLDAQHRIVTGHRVHDRHGRTVFLADAYEATGALPGATPPQGVVGTSVDYDALGRVVVERLPQDLTVKTVAYAAFQETAAVSGLDPVTTTRDGQARVIRTERTVTGPGVAPQGEVFDVQYDPAGRVIRQTVQVAHSHVFTYDTLGRLVNAGDPDLGPRTMTYDDGGRRLTATNALGETVAHTYDAVGRVTQWEGRDVVGTPVERFQHDYDTLPGTCAALGVAPLRGAGRLTGVRDVLGTTVATCLGYDAAGRVDRWRRTVLGTTVETTSAFSGSGLLLSHALAGLGTVTYGYDGAGRLVSVPGWWTATTMDAAGRVHEEAFGNGVVGSFACDAAGRTTGVGLAYGLDAQIGLTLTRNGFGAVTAVRDAGEAPSARHADFVYDGAARLLQATVLGRLGDPGARTWDYRYDGLQRLVSRTGPNLPDTQAQGLLLGSYLYTGPGPRQLTSVIDGGGVPVATMAYDLAGRQTQHAGRALGWSPSDRLKQVTLEDQSALTYAYDEAGQRIASSKDGVVRELRLSEFLVVRDAQLELHVRAGDRVLAKLIWPYDGNPPAGPPDVRYFHTTFGPGPSLLTDAGGATVTERHFEPFGLLLSATANADWHTEPWGFGNKPVDEDSLWADHGARWLSPQTGRWLSPDPKTLTPVERPDLLNPYVGIGGNPVTFWDPDGQDWTRPANRWYWPFAKSDDNGHGVIHEKQEGPKAAPDLPDRNGLMTGEEDGLRAIAEKRTFDKAMTGWFDEFRTRLAAHGKDATGAVGGVVLIGRDGPRLGGTTAPKAGFPRDFSTKNTRNWSASFKSEGQARALARERLGQSPIEVEPNKWRSTDGKWQYRAKPGDVKDNHIHLEELNPKTGEVLQNVHLRWE